MSKWISHQLPVGKRLQQRKQSLHDKCPVCLETSEDVAHLLRCQQDQVLIAFDKHMDDLRDTLEKWDTHPSIIVYLPEILKFWRRHGRTAPFLFPSSITQKDVFTAFGEQTRIGWEQFMEGLISSEWKVLQQKHYNTLDTKLTGAGWASKLISHLWDINHKIWINRNENLHKLDTAQEELYAGHHLKEAIEFEYETGLNGLHQHFSPFFSKYTIEELLDKGLNERLNWFRTIRMARESSNTDRRDNFSEKGPLRRWVGLK